MNAELPTIRQCDVSPYSTYQRIRPSTEFVVGRPDSAGYVCIYSQHDSLEAAEKRRKRDCRYNKSVRVYRVER